MGGVRNLDGQNFYDPQEDNSLEIDGLQEVKVQEFDQIDQEDNEELRSTNNAKTPGNHFKCNSFAFPTQDDTEIESPRRKESLKSQGKQR